MWGWKFSTRPAFRITKKPWCTETVLGGISRTSAAALDGVHQVQDLSVLRLVAFRTEVDDQLRLGGDFLTHGVIVDVPHDPGSGQHQLAAVRPHELTLFADRPFHEEPWADLVVITRGLGLVLLEPGEGVVRNPAPLRPSTGRISIAHTQRASVRPVSTTGLSQTS